MKRFSFLLLLAAAACSPSRQVTTTTAANTANMAIADGKLFTSLYQQRAAEYRALCLQAYNLAYLRLDRQLGTGGRPKAIITDIDETVLDNSAYAVHQGLQGRDWELQSWHEWTSLAQADTVPGAPSFLKYAASRGVQIFYITNRDKEEQTGTLANLRKFDLPNADEAHLFLKGDSSSKESRRQRVMADYDVVLLLGDNLADFSSRYDNRRSESERADATNALRASFGDRFIVLPNPNYGDWEGAFYRYNRFTAAQKDSAIRASLRSY